MARGILPSLNLQLGLALFGRLALPLELRLKHKTTIRRRGFRCSKRSVPY